MTKTTDLWDGLYADDRFHLKIPDENVARFLAAQKPVGEALDIGCGTGRHLQLLRELGWKPVGVDASEAAIAVCSEFADDDVRIADMIRLPFKDGRFQVAVAYGVFCYGTALAHSQAVTELARVLKPGGRAFISIRSNWDWRSGGLTSSDAEAEMEMNFQTEQQLLDLYGRFSRLQYEWREWTEDNRQRKNSNWLIAVEK